MSSKQNSEMKLDLFIGKMRNWCIGPKHFDPKRIHLKLLVLPILVLTALLFGSIAVEAEQIYYVCPNAVGANNGSDWSNAYTSLPSILQRGSTYYVASGNYSGYTFNTPESGTSIIAIKKATLSDHGTNTGWNLSYGTTAAVFPNWTITTDYWLIDGIVGSGKSGHGFEVHGTTKGNAVQVKASNITLRHSAIYWDNKDDTNMILSVGLEVKKDNYGQMTNLSFQHLYIHEIPGCPVRFINVDTVLMERCVLYRNHSDAAWHASGIVVRAANSNNVTLKYNNFENIEGSYVIGFYDNVTHSNWNIYGNVFSWINYTNGVSGLISYNYEPSNINNNIKIFNNSFVGHPGNSQIILNGTGNELKNNYFFCANGGGITCANPLDYKAIINFRGVTHDYNRFSQCVSPYSFTPSAHENIFLEGGNCKYANEDTNPFINWTGENYHILSTAAGRNIGTNVGTIYSIDPDGVNRGADGAWDIGAYEYNPEGLNNPANFRISN
jgi:hypothetical protein